MAFVNVTMLSYTLLKRNGPRLTLLTPSFCNVSKSGRLGIHITLMGSCVRPAAACMSAGSLIRGRKIPSAPAASYNGRRYAVSCCLLASFKSQVSQRTLINSSSCSAASLLFMNAIVSANAVASFNSLPF